MENMSVNAAPATVAKLYVNGVFADASGGAVGDVLSPASGAPFGTVALADRSDMAKTVDAATAGFAIWRKTPAHDRYNVLRSAATLLRRRADSIAQALTIEQGKPVAEARIECLFTADIIDWCAEEAKRCYGRVIPARNIAQTQVVLREPVGPVAAFTPWNFPILQAARKIAAALAAGCSIVIKGPEETPVSCSELVRTFHDAGLPAGVLNLLFGVPKDVSGFLIPHPAIRKVSFTGSTAVGKELAALAGRHMKRVTMELGGHAPVLVFKDANVEAAAAALAASKFRNAGQQCNSPTRFLIQDEVYQKFVDSFVAKARAIRVGDGLNSDSQMGALANERRVHAMEALVSDAVGKGAKVAFGGHRIGNRGFYYSPTVVADVSSEARLMNDEPFGPIAPMQRFTHIDDAIREANRLSFGLTAYAFTSSMKTAATLASDIEVGALWINQPGPPWPEVPFGGVKDSGYGSEGGSESLEPYTVPKLVTQLNI
jgi:succinate-semialdehyde dehydrogenase/glutarate-semialdehyde dehydrogenase